MSAETTKKFPAAATHLAESIAAAHECTAEVVWTEQYPVTVNDAQEIEFVAETLTEAFGAHRYVTAPNPVMGSEDFSFVLNEVSGRSSSCSSLRRTSILQPQRRTTRLRSSSTTHTCRTKRQRWPP